MLLMPLAPHFASTLVFLFVSVPSASSTSLAQARSITSPRTKSFPDVTRLSAFNLSVSMRLVHLSICLSRTAAAPNWCTARSLPQMGQVTDSTTSSSFTIGSRRATFESLVFLFELSRRVFLINLSSTGFLPATSRWNNSFTLISFLFAADDTISSRPSDKLSDKWLSGFSFPVLHMFEIEVMGGRRSSV